MGRAREGKGGSRGRHELQVRPQALQVTGEKPKAVSASAGLPGSRPGFSSWQLFPFSAIVSSAVKRRC